MKIGFKLQDIKLIHLISLTAIMSCIIFRFMFINKTLIPADEGWYLMLLRDYPNFGATRFHLLFKGIFNNNIFLIRLTNNLLTICSNFFFGYCLWIFCKKHLHVKKNIFIILGLVFIGQQYVISVQSFNYATLNLIITEISIGLLLYGISSDKKTYFLLSGFFTGFLIPIMITNIIIVLPIILFIFAEKKSIKFIYYYTIGIILFLAFYFSLIESPQQFFGFFIKQTEETVNNGTSEYGIIFLLKWIIKAFIYIIKIFFYTLIFYIAYKIIRKKTPHNYEFYLTVSILFLYIIFELLKMAPYISLNNIFLILGQILFKFYLFVIFFSILKNKLYSNLKILSIFILLIIIPICLSFGTNLDINHRIGSYLVFITPLLLFVYDDKNLSPQVNILAIITIVSFGIDLSIGKNWNGDKYNEQIIPVSSIGIKQKLYLDEPYINKLRYAQSILKENDLVLCDRGSWGFAVLLNLQPLRYDFKLPEKDLDRIIHTILNQDQKFYLILNPHSNKELRQTLNDIKEFNTKINKHPSSNFTIIEITK